jgi:hypothetical protein
MSEFKNLQQLNSIQEQLARQSLRLDSLKKVGAYTQMNIKDIYAVYADPDKVAHISADNEIFVGTLNDIETWLLGVMWLEHNYQKLKLVDRDRRELAERRERDKNMINMIRTGRAPTPDLPFGSPNGA